MAIDSFLTPPSSSLTQEWDRRGRLPGQKKSSLEPPEEYRFPALRSYLLSANASTLLSSPQPSSSQEEEVVLVDDRRDPMSGSAYIRSWDSEGDGGYLKYPPPGDCIRASALRIHELVARLREKRQDNGADKRTIYIADPSPNALLAMAATVSTRIESIQPLRVFFNRHLTFRAHFSTSMALSFECQFHIPFFALRRCSLSKDNKDRRSLRGRPLRVSRELPLARHQSERHEWYHEAHISFLVTGVDEWFWTSYCCVDTYFGSEAKSRIYLDAPPGRHGQDPATGGSQWLRYPLWNPREYFLAVLARRMTQATSEWRALMDVLQERMEEYEGTSLFDFLDDNNLSRPQSLMDDNLTRTKQLTEAVTTLTRFKDSLSSTLAAWQTFEERDIKLFDMPGSQAIRERWGNYIAGIRADISELKSLRMLVAQKLESFNGARDGLVNASALRESAVATRQGEFIGLLTRMTVLFLPLSWVNSLFSITMIPSSKFISIPYAILTVLSMALTLYAATHRKLLETIFGASNTVKAR